MNIIVFFQIFHTISLGDIRLYHVYRGYSMGGFVYDFLSMSEDVYLARVSAANEWQISYLNESGYVTINRQAPFWKYIKIKGCVCL